MTRSRTLGVAVGVLAVACCLWSVGRTRTTAAEEAQGASASGPEIEVVLAFIKEVQAKRYDAAFALLSPRSRETVGQDQWKESCEQLAGELVPVCAWLAGSHSIDATEIEGDAGVAAVTLQGTKPLPIRLVQESGKWWIDQTTEGKVRDAVDRELDRSLESALFWEYGGLGGVRTQLEWTTVARLGDLWFAFVPMLRECRAISSVREGDRAVVKVAGTASTRLLLPVVRSTGRWFVQWDRASLLPPLSTDAARKPEAGELREALGESRKRLATGDCQSNLKQLGLALMMYAQDYDDRLPPAQRWTEVLYPYVKNESVFKCPAAPELECGYAYNRVLSMKLMRQVQSPAEAVSLFDSTIGKKNVADNGASWPSPGRHDGGSNCAFMDGHVKWYREKPSFAVKLLPAKPKPKPTPTSKQKRGMH